MTTPRIDSTTLAISLAAFGFGVVLIVSPWITQVFVQPMLAVVLIMAGACGLLSCWGSQALRKRRNRKELS